MVNTAESWCSNLKACGRVILHGSKMPCVETCFFISKFLISFLQLSINMGFVLQLTEVYVFQYTCHIQCREGLHVVCYFFYEHIHYIEKCRLGLLYFWNGPCVVWDSSDFFLCMQCCINSISIIVDFCDQFWNSLFLHFICKMMNYYAEFLSFIQLK